MNANITKNLRNGKTTKFVADPGKVMLVADTLIRDLSINAGEVFAVDPSTARHLIKQRGAHKWEGSPEQRRHDAAVDALEKETSLEEAEVLADIEDLSKAQEAEDDDELGSF